MGFFWQVMAFLAVMSVLGVCVVFLMLGRHKWRWREVKNTAGRVVDAGARADLLDGNLVVDEFAKKQEALRLAEEAEEIGKRVKPKKNDREQAR